MNERVATLAPVVRSVTVPLDPEGAFRLYTEGVGTWWLLPKYSVALAEAETCWLETREGGRFMERARDGREFEWGRILTWEPPTRLVHSWYPGGTPEKSTEVEVRFEPEGDGTLVTLEHRGWERLGDTAAGVRSGYESGWVEVLGAFEEAAGTSPGSGSLS